MLSENRYCKTLLEILIKGRYHGLLFIESDLITEANDGDNWFKHQVNKDPSYVDRFLEGFPKQYRCPNCGALQLLQIFSRDLITGGAFLSRVRDMIGVVLLHQQFDVFI